MSDKERVKQINDRISIINAEIEEKLIELKDLYDEIYKILNFKDEEQGVKD